MAGEDLLSLQKEIVSNYHVDDIVEVTLDGRVGEEGCYCEHTSIGYLNSCNDKSVYLTSVKAKVGRINPSKAETYEIPYERIKDIRLVMPLPDGIAMIRKFSDA